MKEICSFWASLPDIQSALSISGKGSSRIKLDVPETELPQVLRLLTAQGQALKITVEVEE